MAILRLIGDKDAYLFDPQNQETLLRENGKFGHVYAGIRESDKSRVVIKHLNPRLLKYPYALVQFRFEADAALDHPHLRKTFEYFEIDGNHFLVQEYVKGHELKVFLMQHEKFRTIPFVVRCVLKILDVLEYLHAKNIVHCDIKPANILIREPDAGQKTDAADPPVRLIDLGNAQTPLAQLVTTVRPFSFIYSPPEQVLHLYDLVGPASDLFALGVTAYELITGKNAYGTYHPEKLMHLQVSGDLVPDPLIPDKLYAILQKATARVRFPLPPNRLPVSEHRRLVEEGIGRRYPDAAAMRKDLQAFMEGHRERKGVLSRLFG